MNTTTTVIDENAAEAALASRERIEADRAALIAEKLRRYPQIKRTAGPNPKFCAYVGPERRYVENYFLSAVIAEIEAVKAPRVTYIVTNAKGLPVGELTPAPCDDNCFFFDVALWNRKTGYVRHAVTVNGMTATPVNL